MNSNSTQTKNQTVGQQLRIVKKEMTQNGTLRDAAIGVCILICCRRRLKKEGEEEGKRKEEVGFVQKRVSR